MPLTGGGHVKDGEELSCSDSREYGRALTLVGECASHIGKFLCDPMPQNVGWPSPPLSWFHDSRLAVFGSTFISFDGIIKMSECGQ